MSENAGSDLRSDRARRVRRRRDRRGRGLRGRLAPAELPISRTRAEEFDDLVLDAVEHLEQRWAAEIQNVQFAVEEVPAADAAGDDELPVALSRLQPATGSGRSITPPRIVLYRRPLEARSGDREDLSALILDVVIHEVAHLLDVDPSVVDPEGHSFDEDDED